jgi:hypothetical protein
MCPHTTIYPASSYYYICVLTLILPQYGLSMRESEVAFFRSSIICGVFRYVPMWQLESFEPSFGPETGASLTTVRGTNFVADAGTSASCRFWDDERSPLVVQQSTLGLLAAAPAASMVHFVSCTLFESIER